MILAIETSSVICSACLIGLDGKILKQSVSEIENSHAEKLPVMVNDLLQQFGKENLKAVAISKGPGSYTGLRIGTSLAKGICFVLNLPLIAVDALYGLALHVQKQHSDFTVVVPHLDARRNEVYMQIRNAAMEEIMATDAVILTTDSFEKYASDKVIFVGNCPMKFKEICSLNSASKFIFQEPLSEFLAAEAIDHYQKKQFEDLAYFQPAYLKNFVAGTNNKFIL